MAHQWLKWPRRSAGQWNPQHRLVAKLNAQLTRPAKLELMRAVFRLHPEVKSATLFGSRAKGTHTHRSDVDLVVAGDIEPLRTEAIAAELEELPLPYRFDVQALAHIQHRPLLEHIQRVGQLMQQLGPARAGTGADWPAPARWPPDRAPAGNRAAGRGNPA